MQRSAQRKQLVWRATDYSVLGVRAWPSFHGRAAGTCIASRFMGRRLPVGPYLYFLESTMEYLLRFVREDEGQDLVEYALLITFIALACIVGMQQLGTAINNKYNSISSSLAS